MEGEGHGVLLFLLLNKFDDEYIYFVLRLVLNQKRVQALALPFIFGQYASGYFNVFLIMMVSFPHYPGA